MAFAVPSLVSRTVAIRYQLASVLDVSGKAAIVTQTIRKQPGISGADAELVVGYPSSWNARTTHETNNAPPAGFLANIKEVRYNTTLDENKEFTVEFGK
jgi:hypothetical protein